MEVREWERRGGKRTEWEERWGWVGLYTAEVIGWGAKMSHTCYGLLFKEERSQKNRGKKQVEAAEGEGGDRMGETIAAWRLTYFHEVMD